MSFMDGPKLPFVMKSSISLLIYADTFRHQSMMRHEITTKIHGLPTAVVHQEKFLLRQNCWPLNKVNVVTFQFDQLFR